MESEIDSKISNNLKPAETTLTEPNQDLDNSMSSKPVIEKVSEDQLPEPPPPSKCANYFRKDLLPFKSYYFFLIGAIGCVIPYVSVFLKMLGQGPLKIGVISGLRPILAFVTAVFWGIVVDRYRIRRIILIIAIACWGVFFFALYMLPTPKMRTNCDGIEAVLSDSSRLYKDALSKDTTLSSVPPSSTTSSFSPSTPVEQFWIRLDVPVPTNLTTTKLDFTADEMTALQEDLSWIYDQKSALTIFLVCLFLICFGEICQPPATFLADAACLDHLYENKDADFAQQRAYGALGWAIFALVAGGLLSLTRHSLTLCGVVVTFSDYRITAVVFGFSIIVAFCIGWFIPFKDKNDAPGKDANFVHDTKTVLKIFLNVHYGSWLICIFFFGFCNGLIWGFLFWHLENIGASQLLLGVNSFLTFIVEFFVFHITGWVISKLGYIGVMYLSLVCYVIRFFIYGMITNPWFSLIADALQGFTFSVCWSSFAEYGRSAVTQASTGCMIGIIHATYFGLGNGLGHLIGGVLIEYFGARETFFGMSGTCFVFMMFFIAAQKLFPKPKTTQSDYEEMHSSTIPEDQLQNSEDDRSTAESGKSN